MPPWESWDPAPCPKGPGRRVTGRQTSVQAVEPAGACRLASDPIGRSLGATMDMDVADGHDKKTFQKFVFCRGDIPAL